MSTADPIPRPRSTSRTRRPPTQPTTPLRAPSRTSLRASTSTTPQHDPSATHPLDTLEPAIGELSDALAALEANMVHLSLLHDSVSRFNDNFAAFLYGLNMSAFCVAFPEEPGPDAARRFAARHKDDGAPQPPRRRGDGDATFLTSDTSFVNDPPASVRKAPTADRGRGTTRGRGGVPARGSTRGTTATRGSGIGRGRARVVR